MGSQPKPNVESAYEALVLIVQNPGRFTMGNLIDETRPPRRSRVAHYYKVVAVVAKHNEGTCAEECRVSNDVHIVERRLGPRGGFRWTTIDSQPSSPESRPIQLHFEGKQFKPGVIRCQVPDGR